MQFIFVFLHVAREIVLVPLRLPLQTCAQTACEPYGQRLPKDKANPTDQNHNDERRSSRSSYDFLK